MHAAIITTPGRAEVRGDRVERLGFVRLRRDGRWTTRGVTITAIRTMNKTTGTVTEIDRGITQGVGGAEWESESSSDGSAFAVEND